jgi:hypothetical protein
METPLDYNREGHLPRKGIWIIQHHLLANLQLPKLSRALGLNQYNRLTPDWT